MIKKTLLLAFLFSTLALFSQQDSFRFYKVYLKWHTPDINTNYLSINTLKGMRVLDTCITDTLSKVCMFKLNTKDFTKGLYTVIKKGDKEDHSKDFYMNVVLDKDSLVEITIQKDGNIDVTQSNDNKVFYSFLKETGFFYGKLNFIAQVVQNLTEQKDTTKRKPFIDSFIVAQTMLDSTIKIYRKKYPTNILYPLSAMQSVYDKLQNGNPKEFQNNKNNFWNEMPFNDERMIRISNFYEVLSVYMNYYTNQNVDSLISALLKIGYHITPKSYVEYVHFLSETFCIGKSSFPRSEDVCVAINDNLVKPKESLFESRFVTYFDNKCVSFSFTKLGKVASDFELLDTADKRVTLRSIKAENYLLVFWDPHCAHCKMQVPLLDSIIKNDSVIKNIPLTIIGIKTDGPKADWLSFINTHNLKSKWIHLEDTKALRDDINQKKQLGFRTTYGIDQTPLLFLLDKEQKIVAKYFMPKELKNFLKPATAITPTANAVQEIPKSNPSNANPNPKTKKKK